MKLNYADALAVEESLPPGPYEIKCFLQAPLSLYEIESIQNRMIDSGVILTGISQKGSILSVRAIKPAPIEGGIAIVPFVAAIAILAGLAITFYSVYALPKILDALLPIGIVLVVGYVLTKAIPPILETGRK